MPKQQKKTEDLGIKLGSDDMVYWQNMITAKERDIVVTEENLKFYKFIVKYAKQELEKAEKEFNSKKS